jgi:hypothetical protein
MGNVLLLRSESEWLVDLRQLDWKPSVERESFLRLPEISLSKLADSSLSNDQSDCGSSLVAVAFYIRRIANHRVSIDSREQLPVLDRIYKVRASCKEHPNQLRRVVL